MKLSTALFTALTLTPTAATVDSSFQDMIDAYVNFGSTSANPDTYDCGKWVNLFATNGTAAAPGAPPAAGPSELREDCEGTRGLFEHLTAFSTGVFPVGEQRLAFQWQIVGTLNGTGNSVHVPAITTWEMNAKGKIQHAMDYFDPTPLSP